MKKLLVAALFAALPVLAQDATQAPAEAPKAPEQMTCPMAKLTPAQRPHGPKCGKHGHRGMMGHPGTFAYMKGFEKGFEAGFESGFEAGMRAARHKGHRGHGHPGMKPGCPMPPPPAAGMCPGKPGPKAGCCPMGPKPGMKPGCCPMGPKPGMHRHGMKPGCPVPPPAPAAAPAPAPEPAPAAAPAPAPEPAPAPAPEAASAQA